MQSSLLLIGETTNWIGHVVKYFERSKVCFSIVFRDFRFYFDQRFNLNTPFYIDCNNGFFCFFLVFLSPAVSAETRSPWSPGQKEPEKNIFPTRKKNFSQLFSTPRNLSVCPLREGDLGEPEPVFVGVWLLLPALVAAHVGALGGWWVGNP